ncbi:MAG TPA: polysaccharide deacetylase family protein [Candidatus Binataceae bacterium]
MEENTPRELGRAPCENILLTWEDLTGLVRSKEVQVGIGSHGFSHQPLTSFDSPGLEMELRTSRDLLRQRLGIEIDSIAYPFGAFSTRVVKAAREAQYRIAFTIEPRHARTVDDNLAIPRFIAGPFDEPDEMLSRLAGWYERFRQVKMALKLPMGWKADELDRRFWQDASVDRSSHNEPV